MTPEAPWLPDVFAGSVFYELALILLASAAIGALAIRLRQPLIMAYIGAGILFGPSVLGVVRARDEIDLLARLGLSVLGVDFDPEAVASWTKQGRRARYGDVEDPELCATLPLGNVRWIVSSIPSVEANLALLQTLHGLGYRSWVAVTAHTAAAARRLEEAGADLVLLPFADAAERAAELLANPAERARRDAPPPELEAARPEPESR